MDASMQDKINKIDGAVTPFINDISSIVVNDQESFDKAGKMVVEFKRYEKMVKETKEGITKPLNEALKSARALFKPIEDKISISKRDLLAKANAYKFEQDRIAREQAKRLEAKIDSGVIKRPETIMKNMDKIQHVEVAGSGLAEATRKEVVFDIHRLSLDYLNELLARPKVFDAISIEIRKDALGNKAQGVEPRVEKGVTVKEVKVVR